MRPARYRRLNSAPKCASAFCSLPRGSSTEAAQALVVQPAMFAHLPRESHHVSTCFVYGEPTMPTTRRRSAVQKRDQAKAPHRKTLTEAKGTAFPAGDMLIASPLEVQRVVQSVPAGRVLTLADLRQFLAEQYGADYTCPITTGIFLRIVAEAALEDGSAEQVPTWRVVQNDGVLHDKLPGGSAKQAARLKAEGVALAKTGARWRVADLPAVRWSPPSTRP